MNIIRKQIALLTEVDLEMCPFWEFTLDEEGIEGQDETTVRPNPDWCLGNGLCAIRTNFILNSGVKCTGYLLHDGAVKTTISYEPKDNQDKIKYYNPTIVKGKRQIAFWNGISEPAANEVAEMKCLLQEEVKTIFPINYSVVLSEDIKVEGRIDGFTYIKREKKGIFFKYVEVFKYIT